MHHRAAHPLRRAHILSGAQNLGINPQIAIYTCRAARLSYSVAHGGQIAAPFSIAQAFVSHCVPERPQMKEEGLLRNASERRGQPEATDPSAALVAAVMKPEDGSEGLPGSPHLTRMSKGTFGLHGRQAEDAGIELSKRGPARGSEGAQRLCVPCSCSTRPWACSMTALALLSCLTSAATVWHSSQALGAPCCMEEPAVG